ncbi:MAG: hypothetical protein HFI13_10015 [Lachnospiraceae bacterium]|nr:hypothetical protein [Lachnospiraceae bacterium]
MGFFRRLIARFRKKEEVQTSKEEEKRRSFFLYIVKTPEIVTYFRREKGIARRKLELTLIDDEDRPAYQIAQIAELLMKDLNFFYLVTEREEAFEELAEEAMEEYGLLMVILPKGEEAVPGNVMLDVREWEKHLDIVTTVGYNTLTM